MVEVDNTYQFQSKVGRIDQELRHVSSTIYHNLHPIERKKKKREER